MRAGSARCAKVRRRLSHNMHILCGSLKGQRLSHAPNAHLRPTADKVKTAVFNMLGQNLCGRCVLDLYSGTGAYGIEALSCGADRLNGSDCSTGSGARRASSFCSCGSLSVRKAMSQPSELQWANGIRRCMA